MHSGKPRVGDRLRVEVHFRPGDGEQLADDVRKGLGRRPRTLPPKYFYDELGSKLFDRICDTPEYYPTRTEHALLAQVADRVIAQTRPSDIVELGSGAARKTRILLDAVERSGGRVRYVPFDVSETMLVSSGRRLLEEYPWLHIHGLVGDYERHVELLPAATRRLILFIGSTIGNFESREAAVFLRHLARQMGRDDWLLLGTDLVKDESVLNAAYNDSAGLTAAFNKNVLSVLNRELDASFRMDRFDHLAFFNASERQVEMHLRSTVAQAVPIRRLDMTVQLDAEETIRTEISRKFTRETVEATLADAGLELAAWHVPDNRYFALSLARPQPVSG